MAWHHGVLGNSKKDKEEEKDEGKMSDAGTQWKRILSGDGPQC